ncbi:hypothetical protein HDU92_004179 [Lobulomyces angularis]|nr:hypothetical protein HDU92_004179 [Lobulomyces angularis]
MQKYCLSLLFLFAICNAKGGESNPNLIENGDFETAEESCKQKYCILPNSKLEPWYESQNSVAVFRNSQKKVSFSGNWMLGLNLYSPNINQNVNNLQVGKHYNLTFFASFDRECKEKSIKIRLEVEGHKHHMVDFDITSSEWEAFHYSFVADAKYATITIENYKANKCDPYLDYFSLQRTTKPTNSISKIMFESFIFIVIFIVLGIYFKDYLIKLKFNDVFNSVPTSGKSYKYMD